jgi:DNA-binding GntR family transcriptional regulator
LTLATGLVIIVLSVIGDCRQSSDDQIIETDSDLVKQMKPTLPQIKNTSIRKQTLDMLREAILTGELRPGQTLVEMDLSKQLGVSRAPIREALSILNSEGLLEIIPYHGTTVRRLTKTDIEELYSMRILLETFAVEQIITINDSQHIEVLKANYQQMVNAGNNNDLNAVNKIDREFHDALMAMSGHSLLMSMWQMVDMRVRQVMALVNRRNTDLTQIARNHLPLIVAIEEGNLAEAKRLLGLHVATAGDLIAEDWNPIDDELGDNI